MAPAEESVALLEGPGGSLPASQASSLKRTDSRSCCMPADESGCAVHLRPAEYTSGNPYQDGVVPSSAVYAYPKESGILYTFYGDTPAPFDCPACAHKGLTALSSSLSAATLVASLLTTVFGFCFLLPNGPLWHKTHFCPACGAKVGELIKDDWFLVADPMHWRSTSFAVPC